MSIAEVDVLTTTPLILFEFVLLLNDRSICDRSSSPLGILVWLIQSVCFRGGHGIPVIVGYQMVVVYKGLSGVIGEFVLQDDQTGRFWTLTQDINVSLAIERLKRNYPRAIFSYCD